MILIAVIVLCDLFSDAVNIPWWLYLLIVLAYLCDPTIDNN